MRQLRLVPSGVQKWNWNSIAATSDAFAYASTMALHIFRLADMTLHKMIAAHERTVVAICWSPKNSNLLASCSANAMAIIWDIENEAEKCSIKLDATPVAMDWASSGDQVAFVLENGDVKAWNYTTGTQSKLFSVAAKDSAKVLRWHPHVATRLLVGDTVGSIHVYDSVNGKVIKILGKAKTSKDPVTDAQWDPLSEVYLLAAFQDGSLVLYDANTQQELHTFDKQAQSIKSIAWARAQPGNFLTATDRVGLLRLWNVSQKAPLSQIKVGTSGVNCIKEIPGQPHWFVVSFKNSSVGICDISARMMRFMSSPGHSETIFDVVFHPHDQDLLATASYDGYVKFWRTSTMENVRELYAGSNQVLYGLALGPGATRVCAVSGTGHLHIWRIDNGEQLHKLQLHSEKQAYRCEWKVQGGEPDGGGMIITGGADGSACVVDALSGSIIRRITHPAPVVGVTWHPLQENVLATGCQDGAVRIFRLPADSPGAGDLRPEVHLTGHDERVFNIAFHPIVPGIIASGSDDKTIRVWRWQPNGGGPRELRRLVGHTHFVRGLLWHSELPGILFSGSWDSTIRTWDVPSQKCLHVVYEHYADVYGLALHPQRPFFLVSSSRDTTLRFWIFEHEVRPMLVQALVRPAQFTDLLGGGPEEADLLMQGPPELQQPPLKLFGQASRQLAEVLMTICQERPNCLEVYQRIISFFMYRAGMEDLWGLLAVARGEPLPGSMTSNRTTFHEQEMILCQRSKALELASQRAITGVVAKHEERLLKAAQIMLRIGDLRQYCRMTAQAGHWEKAICVAPAVSHEFWAELCGEYVETLSATANLDDSAPLLVATGQSGKLVDAYIKRSELDIAFVLAKADADGLLPATTNTAATGVANASNLSAPHASRTRLEDVASVISARYAELGEPLQAAMVFLAVNNVQRAVTALMCAHEVALAYVVSEVLGQPKDPGILRLLAQCAERDQRWDVAADILKDHPHGPAVHLPLLAARCPCKQMAQAWSPWTPEQFKAALPGAEGGAAVVAAVCAGEHQQAAQMGVAGLHALIQAGNWSLAQARELLDPLEALPLQDMEVSDIANILACAAYVGLVQIFLALTSGSEEADTSGYQELVTPLAQTLKNIVTHQNLQFPATMQDVTLMEAKCLAARNPAAAIGVLSRILSTADLQPHVQQESEQLLLTLQSQSSAESPVEGTCRIRLAGGNLPACYKRLSKNSVLTNQLIRGPAFELEDQRSFVSLGDALAWARVNIFSPLNTGCKIQPI